jgi:hypothetical protein
VVNSKIVAVKDKEKLNETIILAWKEWRTNWLRLYGDFNFYGSIFSINAIIWQAVALK